MGLTVPTRSLSNFHECGTYFRIELDSAILEEGSMVTGKLHFDLTKTQPHIELFITLGGYEEVSWHEASNIAVEHFGMHV